MSRNKGSDKPDKVIIQSHQAGNPEDFEGDTDDVQLASVKLAEAHIAQISEEFGVSAREASKILNNRMAEAAKKIKIETVADVSGAVTRGASEGRTEIINAVKHRRQEAQKRDLIDTLSPASPIVLNPSKLDPNTIEPPKHPINTKFKQQSHTLYRDMDPWFKVSEDVNYREAKKDLDLIMANLSDILRTVWHKNAKKLGITEMGPGDVFKIKNITDKILNMMRLGRLNLGGKPTTHVDLDVVDVSGEILFAVITTFLSEIIQQVRVIGSKQLRDNHPWKQFIDFVQKHDKKYTSNHIQASTKVEESFYKMLDEELKRHNGTPVKSIIKYALARYFGLKKVDEKLLDELDKVIQLPLEIFPHVTTFEKLDGKKLQATKTKARVAFHLGDEVCNDSPEDNIRKVYRDNILDEPHVINKREHERNPDDENNIQATYVVFSFQTGKLHEPNASAVELAHEGHRILPAYDNPNFNFFASHLFEKPELSTFSNPKTGEIYEDHTECYDIVPDFVEDCDHPGYYGTVHHLEFTKDVDINITISDKDNKDQETYTFKMRKGQKPLLIPSYKPAVVQIEDICDELDLKVVDVYEDINETNAVFVIRKMTEYEKELKRQTKLELEDIDDDDTEANETPDVVVRHQIRNIYGQFAKIMDPQKQTCA